MNREASHRLWPWALLALAAGVALSGYSQDAPEEEPAPPAVRWEYKQLAWTEADSADVFREVTGGDSLTDSDDLAERLKADGGELRFDPKLREAVEARLQARMLELGAEGWEAYWVRESEVRYGPVLIETPTVLLKRRTR